MRKYLACLTGLVVLLAGVPARGEAPAKQAPIYNPDNAQRPAQKRGLAQKQPSAQGQAPAQPHPPGNSESPRPAGPPAPPQPAPTEQAPIGPVLDKQSASLKQIEASLEHHDLTDAELQALRQQIDPISDAVGSALDRLTPRLAGIKARLD